MAEKPDDPPDQLPARILMPQADAIAALQAARARVETPQPEPLSTQVFRRPIGNSYATAITRFWRPEDVPRCRLCPRCTAMSGVCTVLIEGRIPADLAPLFSLQPRAVIRACGPDPAGAAGGGDRKR